MKIAKQKEQKTNRHTDRMILAVGTTKSFFFYCLPKGQTIMYQKWKTAIRIERRRPLQANHFQEIYIYVSVLLWLIFFFFFFFATNDCQLYIFMFILCCCLFVFYFISSLFWRANHEMMIFRSRFFFFIIQEHHAHTKTPHLSFCVCVFICLCWRCDDAIKSNKQK